MDLRLGTRLRLGVSSCLLGDEVRYDGAHKHDDWIADRFGPMVHWISVCPEADAGLGVPREPIRLHRDGENELRVRGVHTRQDVTSPLLAYARRRVEALDLDTVDGWVFKAKSPSCGVEGVAVFDDEGTEIDRAPGVFAAALLERDPLLPTCNEQDVQVPERRRQFFERAQTRARWRRLVEGLPRAADARERAIVAFLARHELLLVCRERALPLLGDAACDVAALAALGRQLQAHMSVAPTTGGHVEALARLHDRLTDATDHERVGLAILVADLARGDLDAEVPRQLARQIALRIGAGNLTAQHYLDPTP